MSFMKQDIDFRLIGMMVLVVVCIIGLTIFYQSSAGDVVGKYKKLADKYKDLKADYNETSNSLQICLDREEAVRLKLNETKVYQEEAQEGFNEIFEETETELEETSKDLESTESELASTKSSLTEANSRVAQLENDLSSLQDNYDDIVSAAETVVAKADNVESDIDDCENNADANTCIGNVESEYNDLMGKIGDLEDELE